jgi:hypothetical protein
MGEEINIAPGEIKWSVGKYLSIEKNYPFAEGQITILLNRPE